MTRPAAAARPPGPPLATLLAVCRCGWARQPASGRVVITRPDLECPIHQYGRAIMATQPRGYDPAAPTTIQITKGQRADLADIQAALVTERMRHVNMKETLETLINFWKEYHSNDPADRPPAP